MSAAWQQMGFMPLEALALPTGHCLLPARSGRMADVLGTSACGGLQSHRCAAECTGRYDMQRVARTVPGASGDCWLQHED